MCTIIKNLNSIEGNTRSESLFIQAGFSGEYIQNSNSHMTSLIGELVSPIADEFTRDSL